MCGIATIALGRSSRGRIPYGKLRGLTRELLVELSARGRDAAGIAVVNEDDVFVFKKSLRSDRLIVRPRFNEILEKIGPETNFILLHSRAASVGGNDDNYNNHPIIADPIVGIHNGTLFNDDQLFKTFSRQFKAEGDVDSEVIFRLFNMYLERGITPQRSMQMVAQQLIGAFTGAAVDMRHPHQMVVFKYGRPLHMMRLAHYDTLIGVSEIRFYDKARDRMGLKVKDTFVTPVDETGLLIDLNAGRITDGFDHFPLPVKEECKRASKRWNNHWVHFQDQGY